MRISMEFDDGRTFEAKANEKTFMGLASKKRFKEQFGVPAVVMSLWQHAWVDVPNGEVDHDEDEEEGAAKRQLNPEMTSDQLQYLDDEYLAFFVWLELCRRCEDVPDGKWDELVEQVVDVSIDAESDEDPTEAATSTSQPSPPSQ